MRVKSIAFFAVLLACVLEGGATPTAQATPPLKAETLANLHFRTIGPAAMSGRIVDIAVVEANTYTFYVASATGGLWKTTDNGTTFTPVFFQQSVASIG